MKKFRDFESARKFVRKLGLKNLKEWREYCKSGNKPEDIPANVTNTYKKEWKGLGDFLGTGNISNHDKQFLSFKDAKIFLHKLNLSSVSDFRNNKLPKNIPKFPEGVYKKEWKGWGDFLGTGNVRPGDENYLSFTEAREFARKQKLQSKIDWLNFFKSKIFSKNIPKYPDNFYKKTKEWKGWGDFLGYERTSTRVRVFRPFKQARTFARKLDLKSLQEWSKYCKSGNKPDDIPASPWSVYKRDFKGYGDFLGTGKIANQGRDYYSFTEARKFARKLGLNSRKDWEDYCKSSNRLEKIPYSPQRTYKTKGWSTWGDFLGTGSVKPGNKNYRSFKNAREFTQKLQLKSRKDWNDYCKSSNRPDNIPNTPSHIYKKEWKGWGDFLGTGQLSNINKSKIRPNFEKSREEARSLATKYNIKTSSDWFKAHKEGKIPNYLPSRPDKIFSKNRI